MNHFRVVARLRTALTGEPGWDQPEQHHFRHRATGVHIFVYGRDVVLTFGDLDGATATKALGCRHAFYPERAVAAVLEVGRALVDVRSRAAAATAADD